MVIAEVEEIELLEKKSKEDKTLEQLMFPDNCFNDTSKDENNVKSAAKMENRKGQLKQKSKKSLISKSNVEKVQKVSMCDFKTALEPKLKRHIESVHQGIKPFKCNICDYETAQNSNLKRHIERVHEGIKKLPKLPKLPKLLTCDFPDCGKTFFGKNAKQNYENHQKKHLVSKDKKKLESKCDFCNKEYKDLKKHKKGYCLENRDTRKFSDVDIKDPLFVMPKPPIELDWTWRDKHKKERMAKVIPSSYINSVIYSTNQEKIVDLAEANKTLQAQPNIPPGIKNESNELQQAR